MKVLKFIPVFIFSAWLNVLGQQPTKHLYLANDTHTDLMWNGDEDAWYR